MSVTDGIAGAGSLLGASQGKSQQKQANKQLALQNQAVQFAEGIAQQVQQNQQQLFGTAAPAYGGLVNQALYNAGLGGINATGQPSPYGSFTPAAGTSADGGPNGSYVPPAAGVAGTTPAAGSNPVTSNYQGAGAPAPAPGMNNVAAPQYNAQGQQNTGYGPPTTNAPVVTNPNLNHGQPFVARGSEKTLPGNVTKYAAGTPAAPINPAGAATPGYTGPQSKTPGQTTYYPQGAPGTPGSTSTGAQSNTPGVPTNMLGIYNLPQEQLQWQAAREDIDRATRAAENNLRFNLGVQGAGANTVAAALQRTADQGLESESAARRNLAIQAPELANQRLAQAFNFLSPGLSAGTNTGAGNLANSVAGTAGQSAQALQGQANNSFGQVGQTLGNYQQNSLLKQYMNNQGASSPGTNYYTTPPAPYTGTQAPTYNPADGVDGAPIAARALGGPVQQGQTYLVGESGPEEIVAPKNGYVIPNYMLRGSTQLPASQTPHLNNLLNMLRGRA